MRKIILSPNAEQNLDNYFENYLYISETSTDMSQRAFNYSTIILSLYRIEDFFDNTYVIDGRNFLHIEDVCLIEYAMLNNGDIILVRNIYFD